MNKILGTLAGLLVCAGSIVLIFVFKASPYIWFGVLGGLLGAWIVNSVNYKRPGDSVVDSVKVARTLLFPHYFKWIGFATAAAGIAAMVVAAETELLEPARWIWIPVLTGLWLAMWSRERHDDEMMRQVRLTAAWTALSGAALSAITIVAMGVQARAEVLIAMIMFLYHFILWNLKFKLRRDEKYN